MGHIVSALKMIAIYMLSMAFNLIANIFLSLTTCLLIDLIGPVDNKNKPLDNIERTRCFINFFS